MKQRNVCAMFLSQTELGFVEYLDRVLLLFCPYGMSWDSEQEQLSVAVTRLLAGRPMARSSIYAKSRRLNVSSKHPDVIRGTPSLLFNAYRGLLSLRQNDKGAKLTTPFNSEVMDKWSCSSIPHTIP